MLGCFVYSALSLSCITLLAGIVAIDWKSVVVERVSKQKTELVGKTPGKDGSYTNHFVTTHHCIVSVTERYRLMLVVGDDNSFYFDNKCDNLSPTNLNDINTYLARLNANVTLEK